MIQSIIKGFNVWTNALGVKSKGRVKTIDNISLEGITRLRELILDFAISGKMVQQDENDRSSFELLYNCIDDIIKLKKLKNISKEQLLYFDKSKEPFRLPKKWMWVTLGNIALVERGGSPRPIASYLTDSPSGLNWIKIGDTKKGIKYITATEEKINKEGLGKTRMVYPGDFLLTNSMSFGRPYITRIEGCIHDGWLRIHFPRELNQDFLYYLLSSKYVYSFFKNAAAGAVVQNLNSDKVRGLPIPIPPAEEQKRIVTKIEELMSLCDKLEEEQTNNLTTHHQLVKCILENLTQSKDANELQTSWEKISQHFDTLFCTEDSIEQLNQAILELAMKGVLVNQNAKDEPAIELIRRIENSRGSCFGCINKNGSGHTIPKSWIWCSLGDISNHNTGRTLDATRNKGPLREYVTTSNLYWGYFLLDNLKQMRITDEELDRFTACKGDLLICEGGDSGRSAVWEKKSSICFQNHIHRVRLLENINPYYVYFYMKKIYKSGEIQFYRKGIGISGISTKSLSSIKIPLPPLNEQQRIVAKIKEIENFCDLLITKIKKANEINLSLSLTIQELI